MTEKEKQREEAVLLAAIRQRLEELECSLQKCNDKWVYEDCVYRFYHQSFKVYNLQATTVDIVAKLQSLMPHLPMNSWFLEIVRQATGKQFSREHNDDWLAQTRPIVEGFFHARYMLEMICKYGKVLEQPSSLLPSGWAAVLYLFNLR